MRTAAVFYIIFGVSLTVLFIVMPVVSTPNFNLGARQQKHKKSDIHKYLDTSSSINRGHHKKRHAISRNRREAEGVNPPANDNSQQLCSTDKQREIWQSIVYCQPNPTLVELQKPPSAELSTTNDNIVHMMPGHVVVNRCSGSCFPSSQECLPLETANMTIRVMAVRSTFTSGGSWENVCAEIVVEKHVRCQCSCREREEHCDPERHYYDSSECRCRCRNPQDRAVCISSGKEWDDRSCSCACPRSTWRQCSTGYTFDYVNTCNCVSTYLIAASGGLTGVIIVVVVGCLAGVTIILHFRKQRRTSVVLQERRETIHRSLVEAFSTNDLEEEGRNRSFSTNQCQSYSHRTPANLQEEDDSEEDRPIMFRTERDPT